MALLLCGALIPLLASDIQSPSPSPEDFGQYLVHHQEELAPFFSKNGSELTREAVPVLLEWTGRILFFALIVGWAIDVLLARGFAALFAPTAVTFRPAFIYATGRLVLNVILLVLMSSTVVLVAGATHLGVLLLLLVIVFVFVSTAAQVGWIWYIYQPTVPIAVLFYLTVVVIHGFLTMAISTPLAGAPASHSSQVFVDRKVTPKLQTEVNTLRQQWAVIAPLRDKEADETAHLQDKIDQARAEQAELQKQIDEARNSESYLYSQIVKIHAAGDLPTARDRFAALLERFPNGPMTGLVRGQLIQVASELAAQEAAKKQAADTQLHLAQSSHAALLAHLEQGQATLSEMRRALIGKTRAEVGSLLGPPTEIASDRWGFGRQMIFNPLTNRKSGLEIDFFDGVVQGVDYYHGRGAGK